MKTIVRSLALCVALSLCCAEAEAHAFLDHARPAVGSAVHGSPGEIRLWFTTPLEAAFCSVKVLDASGRQVGHGDKQMERGDPTQLRIGVPALAHGTYRVIWHVLSRDTHVSDGDFTFEVLP